MVVIVTEDGQRRGERWTGGKHQIPGGRSAGPWEFAPPAWMDPTACQAVTRPVKRMPPRCHALAWPPLPSVRFQVFRGLPNATDVLARLRR